MTVQIESYSRDTGYALQTFEKLSTVAVAH
jgi:hypothetical protein